MNWDQYMILMADTARLKSKDPSSQIGVVITLDNAIISTGYNGFPIGIADTEERWNDRPTKYKYVCHAERNAIALAARKGTSLLGSTLYLVGMGPLTVPCVECTKMCIQSGISRIVGAAYKPVPDNWKEDLALSKALLDEAGIEFMEMPAIEAVIVG